MVKEFNEYLLRKTGVKHGVKRIRPRIILEFIEEKFDKPLEFCLNIPTSGIGSLTMLEALLLNIFLQISSAKKIFEFGTFLGYSTHILTKNSKSDSIIYSLDLGPDIEDNNFSDEKILVDDINNDNYLKELQAKKGAYFLSSMDAKYLEKVKLIHENSFHLDLKFLNLVNEVELVFIDGGHTYENIENDTKLAEQMSKRPSLIIWHDYNSQIHSDVTSFINFRSRNTCIYHVEHSMMAFQILF